MSNLELQPYDHEKVAELDATAKRLGVLIHIAGVPFGADLDLTPSSHGLSAAAAGKSREVTHEEQLVVWADELAFALMDWLKEPESYDDKVHLASAMKAEIKSIVDSAFELARSAGEAPISAEAVSPSPSLEGQEPVAVIRLTVSEVQSGLDRQKWAEGLIEQLPADHDGRNSWLLNYGRGIVAKALRAKRGLAFREDTQAVNEPASPLLPDGYVEKIERLQLHLRTLISYARWQMTEGANHHPTLPSAVAAASEIAGSAIEAARARAMLSAPKPDDKTEGG